MALESKQVAAISRLFSSGVMHELARKGKSPLFARLALESNLLASMSKQARVQTFFDAAFSILKEEAYRHEYIYKAALTHKILLGKHSLQTASMLTEFRIGDCKADLVILNGTSTVYEVKSERDSLTRLTRQVETYSQVFAKVYAVVGENHIDSVMRTLPKAVGVLRLNARHRISTVREAAERAVGTSPKAIFDAVRTDEARSILRLCGIEPPNVPNTLVSSALRELFTDLKPREAHDAMVRVLRKTRNLSPLAQLISQLPTSLQTAALSIPLRRIDHTRLVVAVNTPLRDAMVWA